MDDIKGKWALVTGASSGLGADFARRLAERGMHTVLVARREQELQKLAAELVETHRVQSIVVKMDLGVADAAQTLFDKLTADGIDIDVLVNNAGFGTYGDFVDLTWESQQQMLQLNVVALTQLTRLFVAPMVERDFGYIMHVSSVAAFQSTPTYATYAASKAYVLSFGEAVAYELRNTGVKMTVLCPGAVATEFLQVSGQRLMPAHRLSMMSSDAVTNLGVRAMLRGQPSIVSGIVNKLAAWSMRFIPRRMAAFFADITMRVQPGAG